MTADDFPDAPRGRPVWLVTLADLALLLVGFFVLLQANRQLDARQVAAAVRAGLGVETPAAMPVAAEAVGGFAPGSAQLPGRIDAVAAWAKAELKDPRVALRIAGSTDGTAADADLATGSAALLAADRARAVAAALAGAGVPIERTQIVNSDRRAHAPRQVLVTLAFVGEEGKAP